MTFSTFFLGNIGQENVLYVILEGKKDNLGEKNKKFKVVKVTFFGFSAKLAIFPTFSFRQFRPGKCVV